MYTFLVYIVTRAIFIVVLRSTVIKNEMAVKIILSIKTFPIVKILYILLIYLFTLFIENCQC